MDDLIILGASVSGMNIFTVISDINKQKKRWNVVAYLDEYRGKEKELFGVPVFKTFEELLKGARPDMKKAYAISAIGSPKNRKRLMEQARKLGFRMATIMHPSAALSEYSEIGEGSILCQRVIVEPFTKMGKYCYIHEGTIVGPKVRLGEAVTINSMCALAANIDVGDGAYISAGSTVIQKTRIGKEATIGAGGVVISDIPANCLAAGVPAEVKREKYEGK